jgi:excisionase family DNA binding protein
MTVADVAEVLSVSQRQVYKTVEEGKIPSFKIGGVKQRAGERSSGQGLKGTSSSCGVRSSRVQPCWTITAATDGAPVQCLWL